MTKFHALYTGLILMYLLNACSTTPPAEHSPEASLADLKVYEGLEVTLFASEPMFSNPTNMDIDAKGRVWVCEAYNYRNRLNPKNPIKEEGDRIMILEDTDGDGKADKSKVFYQGTDINSALGVCVLGNKVIVSRSPHVFIFTDENGDDVPDKKEILYQGIQGEQHDHGMHTFIFGHDGRLYFNMGNEGKVLVNAAGDTVIDTHGRKIFANGKPLLQGMVFRSDLDGSNVEVLAHNFRNNYELTVDPFGTMWQSDNDDDGNKGVRINYVMEQGNFGYRDEMTGASWNTRRTNMEKEIPFRHWHLNDPGAVPNLLQTGSGSPCGMALYEGTMLPEAFHGKMIHAEPGHNVVRSYIVENDGAGYKANIVNLLEGQKDQWFRPSDVTVAPDGSLFVADWYDPGVGGHQVGDLDRGRIYRIAAPKTPYKINKPSLDTPEGALEALINPNPATRYLGWTALAAMGTKAENALLKLYNGSNARHRAQALWLLSKLENGDSYIEKTLSDPDEKFRIMGLRMTQWLKKPILPLAQKLAKDPSPQVRREIALSLRWDNSNEGADLWAQIAQQYDGKDRWYLEALGIGSDPHADLFFNAWKKSVGNNWNTPQGRDIVWRSRSKNALPLLAQLIKESNEKDMLRYFRAFDFHKDPSKQQILSQLAIGSQGEKALYALKHLDPTKTKITPALTATLNKILDTYKGRLEFVELVNTFRLEKHATTLLEMGLAYPDSIAGKEAIKSLVQWGHMGLFDQVLGRKNKPETEALVKTLRSQMNNAEIMGMMERIVFDSTQDIGVRKLALRAFGGPRAAEDRLLALAQEKKIPKELQMTAAGVFQTAWRQNIREDGAKSLNLPPSKEGVSLPPISVLATKTGNSNSGKVVFSNLCSTCHVIGTEGTNFGPALSEIGTKLSKEALYSSILYPDQGISFGFEGYLFKLKDGSEAFGMVTSETAEKIELKYITTQQTLNKSDVVSKTKMETSLMPSNLQASMSEQEIVDLVEYLSGLKTAKP